jgi:hypothetical protein
LSEMFGNRFSFFSSSSRDLNDDLLMLEIYNSRQKKTNYIIIMNTSHHFDFYYS